jgi:hypothetical protein
MNAIGMRYDSTVPGDEWLAGYDFQNWFDGAAPVLRIAGQEGGTRRRFARP